MYCPNCDSEVESVVRTVSETYPVKGEDVEISASVRFCSCCGKSMWDDDLDAKNLHDAFSIYRERHNLLQACEIRAVREKYGLTQVAFARVLGLGDKTIARYENGSIPDPAQNNLIELVQRPSNFEELLEKNRDKISEQDYRSAKSSLDALRLQVIYNYQTSTPIYTTRANTNLVYRSTPEYWGDLIYA